MTRAKDISKIVTDADLSGTLDVTGETTLATHLNMGDNDIIKLGASADLQISHDGSNSNIDDTGTGPLRISSNGTGIDFNKGTSETMAKFKTDGAVELYHDGTKKFETTSSGVTATGLVKTSNTYQVWLGADVLGSTGGLTSIGANPIVIGTDGTERMRIDGSSGNVGIGETSPLGTLHVRTSDASLSSLNANADDLIIENNGNCGISIASSTSGEGNLNFIDSGDTNIGRIQYTHSDNEMIFRVNDAERMRIKNYGSILIGTTNASPAEGTTAGTRIGGTGATQISVDGQTSLLVNRVQDGRVVDFRSAGTLEGEIGISGTTTTYGGFTGTHWSRFTDNSQPTILKGTIIETIDEMCDWYQAEFTKVAEVENGVEVLAEEIGRRTSIALPDGKSVGDTISITYEDVTYDDAVIVKEDDDKHTKCKISDIADSKSVYGVFCAWDADDDNVNDMKVASLGTHVVRIHKDVIISKGDLLVSNGDGTAKVQDDDIIRSKTIGKVLTNIVQETYDDGSYTVPCALYCG